MNGFLAAHVEEFVVRVSIATDLQWIVFTRIPEAKQDIGLDRSLQVPIPIGKRFPTTQVEELANFHRHPFFTKR